MAASPCGNHLARESRLARASALLLMHDADILSCGSRFQWSHGDRARRSASAPGAATVQFLLRGRWRYHASLACRASRRPRGLRRPPRGKLLSSQRLGRRRSKKPGAWRPQVVPHQPNTRPIPHQPTGFRKQASGIGCEHTMATLQSVAMLTATSAGGWQQHRWSTRFSLLAGSGPGSGRASCRSRMRP
jgi:hypothetical protein